MHAGSEDELLAQVVGEPWRFGCERPSRYVAWMVSDDEGGTKLVPARCGAPNKCRYCCYMVTLENAVLVGRDAWENGPPAIGMTLTTVDPQHSLPRLKSDVKALVRKLRQRAGPALATLGFVEWTTGESERSGGYRRVHVHMLVRGVDPALAAELEDITRGLWEARTGANRVEFRALRTAAGATAYLVFHDRKRIQAPPAGVRVTRFRPSRNYFDRPVGELRAQAQAMLRERRLQRAAGALVDWEAVEFERDPGYAAWEFEEALKLAREQANLVCLVKVNARTGEIRPLRRAA